MAQDQALRGDQPQGQPGQDEPPATGPDTGLQLAAIGTLISIGRTQRKGPPTGQLQALAITGAFKTVSERRWPLLLILAVQAALTFRLNWTNTAFMDEAMYIWAGHLEWAHWIHGASVPNFSTYFSGSPAIYPPLAALADAVGGLAGARLLSLAFMLGTTVLLYFTTRRLYGNVAGLAGAAVFAVIGCTSFVGGLATYDSMALFLMAASATLTVLATGRRRAGELLLFVAGLLLALANATKYATMLWDPVIFGLAILLGRRGVTARIMRGLRLALYTAAPIAIALYLSRHTGYIQGIKSTTLTRQSSTTPPFVVLRASFNWVGMVAVLALFGTGLSLAGRARDRWVVVLMTAAVFLAPVEEARIHTTVSLQKHVDYGAWFAAIAAGYFAARLHDVNPRKWLYGLLPCLLVIAIPGGFQATSLFSVWPKANETTALRATIARVGCPCLASQNEAMEYYLYPELPTYAVAGPYSFEFHASAKGPILTGAAAYKAAIEQGYFHVVELDKDPEESATYYTTVEQALHDAPGYVLTAVLPNSLSPQSPVEIWYNELAVPAVKR